MKYWGCSLPSAETESMQRAKMRKRIRIVIAIYEASRNIENYWNIISSVQELGCNYIVISFSFSYFILKRAAFFDFKRRIFVCKIVKNCPRMNLLARLMDWPPLLIFHQFSHYYGCSNKIISGYIHQHSSE